MKLSRAQRKEEEITNNGRDEIMAETENNLRLVLFLFPIYGCTLDNTLHSPTIEIYGCTLDNTLHSPTIEIYGCTLDNTLHSPTIEIYVFISQHILIVAQNDDPIEAPGFKRKINRDDHSFQRTLIESQSHQS
ncbi:hypothetical protein BgiMline_031324 [Biomphalaria glabrata]|nr:hypothetical protein BgiMline_019566 [Biomphalaria glabrata]